MPLTNTWKKVSRKIAIVRHALLRHQASLDIESEPGRGSRFTLEMPAVAPDSGPETLLK